MSYNNTDGSSGRVFAEPMPESTVSSMEAEMMMTQMLMEASDQETAGQNYTSSPAKARNISIKPQDFGYLVNIGCQSFAISKLQDLMIGLEAYLTDPDNTENQWFKGEYKIGE